MRFIIPELPYEQPLAKGRWLYERDGTATGAVEHWRLSTAREGFHFLRIDLDARSAPSGKSYLYHLVLDPKAKPVRLKYRLWQGSSEVVGNLHIEEDNLLFTSGQDEDRLEKQLTLTAGFAFWFPSSTALGMLAAAEFDGQRTAVHLVDTIGETGLSELRPQVVVLKKQTFAPDLDGNQTVDLRWQDQRRTLALDADARPLRMQRQDGLSARETQLVIYQRISKPGESDVFRQA